MTREEFENNTIEFLRTAGGTRPDLRVVEVNGRKSVVKDFRRSDFLFRAIVGPILVAREACALALLRDLPGVPNLIGRVDRYSISIEYIDAPSLGKSSVSPPQSYFDRLSVIMDTVHSRGVVHCDLRSGGNALVDANMQPWVIDFAASVIRGRGLNPFINFLFKQFVLADNHAVLILKRKSAPELLTPEEQRLVETPLPFEKIGKAIGINIRNLTRRLLTRKAAPKVATKR